MTVNSTGQDSDQPINAKEVTRCLERELRLREGANAVGSPCSPPTKTSHLLQQLQQLPCISNPCSQRSYLRGLGRGRGSSSSPSASSDSTSRDLDLATASSINSLPNATSARPLFLLGSPSNRIGSRDCQTRVIGQVGRGEPMLNSPIPGATVGRGKNVLPPTAVIAKAPKPKRKRLSKKPPTQIVEATQEEFRAKVQELTGCKMAAIVRPQPERPQLAESCQPERPQAAAVPIAVPIGVDVVAIPPARPESSSTCRVSVPSPSPAVSNRIPEAAISFRDLSGSSGRSSTLNYCMGYEQATFPFMDPEDARPEDSGIPDDDFQRTSGYSYGHPQDATKDTSNEVGEKATIRRTGASYQAAPLPASESIDKRDDIPRERIFLGSAMLDNSFPPSPSKVLVPNHRPMDPVDEYQEYYPEFDPDLFFEPGLAEYCLHGPR